MQQNLNVYNAHTHEYTDYRLYPAEQIIFGKFEDKWSHFRMLDIGIGTGRTTHFFAPLVKHYTGIDYAELMVQQCRKQIPEASNIALEHADARDLSKYYDQSFDFVLFSLNGIDSVDHDDRVKILQEVSKVLNEDGYFFFSSHSLRAFKNYREYPRFKWHSPLVSLYRWYKNIQFNRRMKSYHSDQHVHDHIKNKWVILKTGDHNFNIDIYHIDPVYQIEQLNAVGFDVVSAYGLYGGTVDINTTTANTIYYLCKLKSVNN